MGLMMAYQQHLVILFLVQVILQLNAGSGMAVEIQIVLLVWIKHLILLTDGFVTITMGLSD